MRSAPDDRTAIARIRDAAIDQWGQHGFHVGLRAIAEAAGVSAATIKHYLREGLLPEPVRTSRNMAYYPPEFVERIQLIKRLQETRFMPLKAIKAVLDEDPEQLREALADLGFLSNLKRVEAERLMAHVKAVGGWYLEDREVTIDSEYVMNVMTAVTDPRSEFYALMRRENLPANELMGRRMETGVMAVLGQLEATRNWYRIGREWWFADEPATELGREEWAYFEARGEKRVKKFSSRR